MISDTLTTEEMTTTERQLEVASDLNETRAKLCGWVVIAGLVLEVALTATFPAHEPEQANWYLSLIETWAPVFADALVALGVWGEIFFSGRVRKIEGELRDLSKERAAKAELETEKLRAQFAWRRLSPEAIKGIFETLSGFPKMSVMITFVGNDPESNTFAHDIGEVFAHCGWSVGFTSAAFSGPVVFGIKIAQPDSPENIPACGAARTAASKAGLEYVGGLVPQWFMGAGSGQSVSSPCAQIYVGPKPMPKLE